tara:strand:- start:13727 stop:14074 length:348 start_codon:yes stop_codon:yes gene_type:complete
MNEAYKFLKRNNGGTTVEVYDFLKDNNTRFHLPRLVNLGLILSHSPLFEKGEAIKYKNTSGNNSTTYTWRARSLREIVDRAMITNNTGNTLPKFFKDAIVQERGRLNAENSMVEE